MTNTTLNQTEIGFFLQTNTNSDEEIRFMQIGVETINGFNGLIYGYVGGGEYQETWVINGKTIEDIEYEKEPEYECLDGSEIEEIFMEECGETLFNNVYKKLNEITDYHQELMMYMINDTINSYTHEKVENKLNITNDIYYDKEINPITYGNTIFSND